MQTGKYTIYTPYCLVIQCTIKTGTLRNTDEWTQFYIMIIHHALNLMWVGKKIFDSWFAISLYWANNCIFKIWNFQTGIWLLLIEYIVFASVQLISEKSSIQHNYLYSNATVKNIHVKFTVRYLRNNICTLEKFVKPIDENHYYNKSSIRIWKW